MLAVTSVIVEECVSICFFNFLYFTASTIEMSRGPS